MTRVLTAVALTIALLGAAAVTVTSVQPAHAGGKKCGSGSGCE